MTSFYGGGAASTSGGGSTPAKGALIFKGTLGISDDGATVLVLPDEHEEGWTYLVVTAGTYAGQLCEKGDFVICVSSGEAASDLDWTVVQGNIFSTLPTPTALDEGKIIAVDALGNYVLIDNPSSEGGTTENLPDPSEADEGKFLSVGADGNYTLTDNPAKDKLDKNNGTATGTTTFDKAQANRLELLVNGESIGGFRSIDLTPAVTDNGDDSSMKFVPLFIGEPTKDAHAATKKYVDDKAGNYLPLAGGTMTGSIDAGENTVTNLKEPEEGADATTKNYVDGEVAKAAPVSIMPIPEVSGEKLIQVKDSVEWPLQGIRVYGKSTQDGAPSPESPVPIVSAGDGGSIGLTVSDGADQSQSLTISTPNGLPGIPVDSGGNYTDAEGQQWVCDVVDLDAKALISNIVKATFNGGFVSNGGIANGLFKAQHNFRESLGNLNIPSICDMFVKGSVAEQRYVVSFGILYVQIDASILKNGESSTIDDVNAFFAEHPVTVIAQRSAPLTIPLSHEEIAAYRDLHTYDGTTIMSTDEDISGLKVKYVAKAIDYQQSINAAIQATNDKIDAVYNSLVKKAESVDEVNQLFKDWWNANWEEDSSTYNDMLERWFGKVLDDDKVYGVKLPLFETSTSPQGEYIEDSVGLTITNSTDDYSGQNDFAKTPQFWCVEVAAEKNADGSHTIYACEFIDDIDVVRNGGPDNGKHLVWVLQKNTYVREYEESGYSYIKIQCHPEDGFVQWPQGTDRTGHTYSYIANPKYAAGIDDEGNIGCRTGLKPTCYMSMNQTIQAWRARGSQYSGSSACFYKWAYIMYALLTAKKGEDVGCNNYDYQYAAAVLESGVSRIILTTDQANNLYVGSNVIIGNTEGNTNRSQAAMYSLIKLRKISSIEEVNIEEDVSSYKAVYIDVPDGTTFDTTVGTTYISTMPYYSGWTDNVKGTIGTKYSANLNKQPFLLQKVELMNGAYNYASDELDQWSQQDDTHYLYSFYLCEDQTKVSTNGAITDDYIKKENATLTIDTAVYTTNNNWYYIEDNLTDNNFKMLTPKKFSTSAGSGTGTRDAFYLNYAASGVRMPNVWADLQIGGVAGLSCRVSGNSPSWTLWDYAGGCPGLSG